MFDVKWDETSECFILSDMELVFTALDDSLANINMILGSRYVKPLREEAEKWQTWILTLSDIVDEWLMCQKNWRYLVNIFKAADIRKAMAEETKKFETVTKFFQGHMATADKKRQCIKWVNGKTNTLEALKANNIVLDDVQKKLEDYMELKRGIFPRFYFLSNDELIDILANSQDLNIIQQHMKTCFDNIVKLDIVDE